MLLAFPGWWRGCWDCHGKSVFIWRTKAICTLRKLSSYLLETAEPRQLKSFRCDAEWKQWLQHHELLFWVGHKLLEKIFLAEHICNISTTKIYFHPQILMSLFEDWTCYRQTHLRGQEIIQLGGLARKVLLWREQRNCSSLSTNLSEYLVCHLMTNPELKLEDSLIDNIYFNKKTQKYRPQQIYIADIQLLFDQIC